MESAISYKGSADCYYLLSLNPRPIDCKFLILDFEGLAKTILCKLRMLIPVEKVP
jgi:hypothetical protein